MWMGPFGFAVQTQVHVPRTAINRGVCMYTLEENCHLGQEKNGISFLSVNLERGSLSRILE